MASKLKLNLGGLKLDKLDLKGVMALVKGHIMLVASALVITAVAILAPLTMMEIEASTAEVASEHAAKMAELAALERVQVPLPTSDGSTQTQNALLNQKLIDAYKAQVGKLSDDSIAVRKAAVALNRKGRSSAFDFRVAEQSPAKLRQIHLDAFAAYSREWTALFAKAKVAEPPTDEEIIDFLQRRRSAFVTGQFKKADSEPLSEDERVRLSAELARARLERYFDSASRVRIYGSPQDLGVPSKAPAKAVVANLFEYQWRFWVMEDLLAAFASVNANSPPTSAPVKRIDSVKFLGSNAKVAADDAAASGAGAPLDPSAADAAPAGSPIDPRQKVDVSQFAASFTGRSSNQLYDVYLVDLRLVVETSKIPAVLDAIGAQNFMTVLNVTMRPADSFAAASEGYMFGAAPVSQVRLLLETIWLREWTAQFMPDALRNRLGTSGVVADRQVPGPAGAATSS
ncbi:MAG: hypothetical protein EXS00_07560 [Phycisphaerales bacterium]|nr:hypothetical protein [Phycisphaerales bacterium]